MLFHTNTKLLLLSATAVVATVGNVQATFAPPPDAPPGTPGIPSPPIIPPGTEGLPSPPLVPPGTPRRDRPAIPPPPVVPPGTPGNSQPPVVPPGTPGLPTPTQIALDNAKATWEMQSTGFYDFQYTKNTMMSFQEGYPWTVKVRRGRVSDVVFSNGTAVPITPSNRPPTISHLLETIQTAIDQSAHSVNVAYSPAGGYPADIRINYDSTVSEDELYVTVSDYIQRPAYDFETVQDALNGARNLWSSYSIEAYSFGYEEFCLICSSYHYPWTIQVAHEQTRAIDSSAKGVVNQTLSTIPHLFDVIQDALDNEAFGIKVKYHPDLGFPISIDIDYDPRIADEELALRVTAMNIMANPRAELALAVSKWESYDFPLYNFLYQEFSNSMDDPTWLVAVHSDGSVSVTDARDGDHGEQIVPRRTPPTFGRLFAVIEDALNRNAARVDVTYDVVYGFPERIFLDYDTRSGDEKTIVVSQFVFALN